jgi:hypothetical protein
MRRRLCWWVVLCARPNASARATKEPDPLQVEIPPRRLLSRLAGRPHGGRESRLIPPHQPPAATPSDPGGCCFLNGSFSYKSRSAGSGAIPSSRSC